MNDFRTPDAPGDPAQPTADIDGYSLDELSDYLDAGQSPADPGIDHSPACQLALDSLARVRAVSLTMLEREATELPPIDESWIDNIIGAISLDVHAGRDIPLHHSSPSVHLSVTEGAVKGLVRAAGDRVPGLLVGRCQLIGDVITAGSHITLTVETTAYWGENIPEAVTQLRHAIAAMLAEHTELVIVSIDITVRDMFLKTDEAGEAPSS
ncbi:hypothetical protein [Salinibacterium sp.]|uniref:hypothetical protein n=1 Tax=Salinibacterium sp. TaxID=1915057 RepID=UPI00286B00BC|nr:hypothetical protein [Salinibacterium sp.]